MATTSIPGGGNNNVAVYGNGSVVLGNGNNSVSLGSGSVVVGNGNDTVNLQGSGTVNAGSGNNQIAMMGSGQVSVGGGSNGITLLGSGQIVQTGTSGHDTINISNGNDSISIQGSATVSGTNPYAHTGFDRFGQPKGPAAGTLGTFGGATIAGGNLQVQHVSGVTQDIAVSGAMTLVGSTRQTEFVGGSGTTVMKGGSGHDTFIGGTGHDTMTGIGTHNVFEFFANSQGGSHVIANFVSGDQLNVDGHSLNYLIANNQVTSQDGNTYISADGGKTTIELQGVTLIHGRIVPHAGPQAHGPIASGASVSSGLGQHATPDLVRHLHDPTGKIP